MPIPLHGSEPTRDAFAPSIVKTGLLTRSRLQDAVWGREGRLEVDLPGRRERVGGVEYYLIEQEGSRYSELETSRRCLEAFRKTHEGS